MSPTILADRHDHSHILETGGFRRPPRRPPVTPTDQPTAESLAEPIGEMAPRQPERWFAGLVALVLAILGAALPAGTAGSALAGLRSDARQAEVVAPARAAILPAERSEQAAVPARHDGGDDPGVVLPARHLTGTTPVARPAMPASVADLPRRSVRTGPRQPTGPPVPV